MRPSYRHARRSVAAMVRDALVRDGLAVAAPCSAIVVVNKVDKGRPRRPKAPGSVLPLVDLEPRALKVVPHGPLSPSGPPPVEDLPRAADGNPRRMSLERGVLSGGSLFSNKSSIVWRRHHAVIEDQKGVPGPW
ncbi:exported protein of unknown function [Streptomyces sp. KY75]|nr:exported protein of unknown function [Streptomyces sp. KY70]CAD5980367.1 exported protein of unknown function [Streptomyces sp. KY75]